MAKLTKKEREHIALLVNSITVAQAFIADAIIERDNEKFDRWWTARKLDTITLYEQYGIELAMLQDYLREAA